MCVCVVRDVHRRCLLTFFLLQFSCFSHSVLHDALFFFDDFTYMKNIGVCVCTNCTYGFLVLYLIDM